MILGEKMLRLPKTMTTTTSLILVSLIALFVLVAGDDDNYSVPTVKGLTAHVSRKGCRIELYREQQSNKTTGKITIIFSELREVDANGAPIPDQSGGKGKHSYNAFDKQDFSGSTLYGTTLNNSDGIKADCYKVQATLFEMTTFTALVCTTKSNGTIMLGEETTFVSEGQLKFTVVIDNWSWSTNAKYLEMLINIKIPNGQDVKEESSMNSKRPKKYSFGGNAYANFSSKVKSDGNWTTMDSGFPKYEKKGANNYITIRFNRFNTTGEYDPTVDPGTDYSSSPSKGSFIINQGTLQLSIFLAVFVSALNRCWMSVFLPDWA